MSSNLIDVDLRGYEPEEEPEHAQPKVPEIRPIGRVSTWREGQRKLPHPPGPAGLDLPPTRVWIKRPPGPAWTSPGHARRSSVPRARPGFKRLWLGARMSGLVLR